MLRALAWIFWLIVLAVLVMVGIANRGLVTLRAMPEALADALGISPDVQVPLFLVIFLAVAVGLLIGFLWEWLREAPIRAEARRRRRQVDELRREVGRIHAGEKGSRGEDILALIDGPKTGPQQS